MFKRYLVFIYGVTSYVVFLATFLYLVGFVGNLFVPAALDGAPRVPLGWALVVNLVVLSVFATQHSLMARPFFKRWLVRYVPESAERSTYVLFSSVALIAVFTFWRPTGGVLWDIHTKALRTVLYVAFGLGWVMVLVATFLINHFDLFGLRQVWLQLLYKPYTSLEFRTPGPYKWVRHPLYLGFLVAFWSAPTMTVTHFLFASSMTLYVVVAIGFEERDLLASLGDDYCRYIDRVPMLVPFSKSTPTQVSPVDPEGLAASPQQQRQEDITQN